MSENHRLLLTLAGRLPDAVLTRARASLAAGDEASMAREVVTAALAQHAAVTADEAARLGAALGGGHTWTMAAVRRAERVAVPPYGMAPAGPDVLAEHGDDIPFRMDLTTRAGDVGGPDAVDTTAAVWCAGDGQAYALWRSWRYPADGTPRGPARRLYLVQARDGAALPAITAGLQATLAACGEASPQVETFVEDRTLPAYQQRALSCSALLWTAEPPGTPRLLTEAAPPGPGLADAARVAAYLDAGRPLSVVQDSRGTTVDGAYRTDGVWIWPATTGRLVRERRQDPGASLLAHIRDRAEPPVVGAVAVHRALCALYGPAPAPDARPVRRGPGVRVPVLVGALVLLGGAGVVRAVAGRDSLSEAVRPPAAAVVVETAAATAIARAPSPSANGSAVAQVSSLPSAPPATTRPAPRRSSTPSPAATTTRPPAAATPAAGRTRVIQATTALRPGQSWTTDRLSLAVTTDGNVVLRDRGATVWSTGTGGQDARELVFQDDGNLVLYAGDNSTLWSSGTPGNNGAVLTLAGDGTASITLGGRRLWRTTLTAS